MTQKPREHLELSRTCRNDVGTSIDPSATASDMKFSENQKKSTHAKNGGNFWETQKNPLVSVVILR